MPDWRVYTSVLGGVAVLLVAIEGAAQQPKPAAKAAPRTTVVTKAGPPRGPVEKYDCKVGTEDQHARMALMAQGGQVQSIAYYSKWKPRTCSVHLQRGDAFTRWSDTGEATTINTQYGDFLVQVNKAEYHIFFREVDRMHYCGMMGKLNGSMIVTRGPRRTCSVEGIMDRSETETLDEVQEPAKPAAATVGPAEKGSID